MSLRLECCNFLSSVDHLSYYQCLKGMSHELHLWKCMYCTEKKVDVFNTYFPQCMFPGEKYIKALK